MKLYHFDQCNLNFEGKNRSLEVDGIKIDLPILDNEAAEDFENKAREEFLKHDIFILFDKMKFELPYESPWRDEDEEPCKLALDMNTYAYGGGYALRLWTKEEGYVEPYADLTVNLGEPVESAECVYIDTNNLGNAEKFMKDNKLGEPTGEMGYSGFCSYPLYKLDMNRIKALCFEAYIKCEIVDKGLTPEEAFDFYSKEKAVLDKNKNKDNIER